MYDNNIPIDFCDTPPDVWGFVEIRYDTPTGTPEEPWKFALDTPSGMPEEPWTFHADFPTGLPEEPW